MNLQARILELNTKLSECEQLYRSLQKQFPDLSLKCVSRFNYEKRREAFAALYCLLDALRDAELMFRDVKLENGLQSVAIKPLQFYRDVLLPKRNEYDHVLFNLLGAEIEFNSNEDTAKSPESILPNSSKSTTVWNILIAGLDYWQNNDDSMYTNDELKAAERLMYSSFFVPDEWLRNTDELQPILGDAAEQRIPINIRIRIRELYRSYILSNYLAAIALSRAILEYALIDRAGIIGIQVSLNDPHYPNRTRRLGDLVEDASNVIPELKTEMESILDAGNKTLHPKKRDKSVFHSTYLHCLARSSVEQVVKIIERLYFSQ
jgi:hypothetical protein